MRSSSACSRLGLAVTALLTVCAGLGGAGLLGAGTGCSSHAVTLRSDGPEGQTAPVRPTAERIAAWRDELGVLEARRIRGADPAAYDRVRGWLARLQAAEMEPSTEALLVTAIDGELAVLRTNEQRFGTKTTPPEPPPSRPEATP